MCLRRMIITTKPVIMMGIMATATTVMGTLMFVIIGVCDGGYGEMGVL